jgi:hypothetical protein
VREKNAERVLCGLAMRGTTAWAAFAMTLVETDDPCDAAHAEYDAMRFLRRADAVPRARRRMYPESQIVRAGGVAVAFDSACEAQAALAAKLSRQGVDLWWRPGLQCRDLAELVRAGRLSVTEARAITEPRTKVRLTPEEMALEWAAGAILRGSG